MEEDETPVGCTASRKKLDEDLRSGAEKSIIDGDVADLKKCLDGESETNQE